MSIADTIIWLHEMKMRNGRPLPEILTFERRMAKSRHRWFRKAWNFVDSRPSCPMLGEPKKAE